MENVVKHETNLYKLPLINGSENQIAHKGINHRLAAHKKRIAEINHPTEYEKLYLVDKMILNAWIVNQLEPYKIKTFTPVTTYRLKHLFENSKNGFYISNGAMKGALLIAGFVPKDEFALNWTFQLSKKLNHLNALGVGM